MNAPSAHLRSTLTLSCILALGASSLAFPAAAFAEDAAPAPETTVSAPAAPDSEAEAAPAESAPVAEPAAVEPVEAVEPPAAVEAAEPVEAVAEPAAAEPPAVPEPAAPADAAPPAESAPAPAPESDAAAEAAPAASASSTEPVTEIAPEPAGPPIVEVVDPATTTPDEVLSAEASEPTVTLFAEEPPALPAPGDPCYPAVCIDNGTVLLAVNPTGELNTADGTGSAAGPGDAGLEFLPTGNDSTSPGCLCEGWGVADPATGVWGGANIAELGAGGENLTLESFTHTGSTATSVVTVNDGDGMPYFRVTHEYVPSAATPNLYQVNVTIENMSGAPIATVQYRRVMDWDVEPTAFSEFVTIDGGSASALTYTSDDGFASSNPLSGPSSILGEGDMVDSGPSDHGALFDFDFGPLGAGASLSFVIFYGGAASESEAQAALAAVGAEAYSFGQTSDDPAGGTPNTFIFAFGKVGGAAIFTPPAEVPVEAPAVAAPVVPVSVVTAVEVPAPVAAVTISAPALAVTGAADGTLALSATWSAAAGTALLLGLVLIAGPRVLRRVRRER